MNSKSSSCSKMEARARNVSTEPRVPYSFLIAMKDFLRELGREIVKIDLRMWVFIETIFFSWKIRGKFEF
jgi:hypothetical protein